MRAGGTRERKLTDTPLIEESPDWQPLPFSVGAEGARRSACGDRSLAPGGISSIVAVRSSCTRAHRTAVRWRRRYSAERSRVVIGSYACRHRLHSFDQIVVQCRHRNLRKGFAFVYRRAA